MDFAEIRELNHILVPTATGHPQKTPQTQTEEDLVNAFKTSAQIFDISPGPSNALIQINCVLDIKELIRDRLRSGDMDFTKPSDASENMDTGSKEGSKGKSGDKERAEMKPLREQTHGGSHNQETKAVDITEQVKQREDWIRNIVMKIATAAILNPAKTGIESPKQNSPFVKMPLKEGRGKSLLTKLLDSVQSFQEI